MQQVFSMPKKSKNDIFCSETKVFLKKDAKTRGFAHAISKKSIFMRFSLLQTGAFLFVCFGSNGVTQLIEVEGRC